MSLVILDINILYYQHVVETRHVPHQQLGNFILKDNGSYVFKLVQARSITVVHSNQSSLSQSTIEIWELRLVAMDCVSCTPSF